LTPARAKASGMLGLHEVVAIYKTVSPNLVHIYFLSIKLPVIVILFVFSWFFLWPQRNGFISWLEWLVNWYRFCFGISSFGAVSGFCKILNYSSVKDPYCFISHHSL